MPCLICKKTILVFPCEHKDGIINKDNFKEVTIQKDLRDWYLENELLVYIEAYKELHDRCPCKDCLLKTMCMREDVEDLDEICEKYSGIINSIKEKYLKKTILPNPKH